MDDISRFTYLAGKQLVIQNPPMIPISNKDQRYFLSIVHITKQAPDHPINQ
jgi:hypothetical protein